MLKFIKPTIKSGHNIIKNDSGDVCIGEVPGLAQIIESPPEWVVLALQKMDGRHTSSRILKELVADGHSTTDEELTDFIQSLAQHRLLEDSNSISEVLSTSEVERYDRQMLQFGLFDGKNQAAFKYQETLRASRVAVLGLGGWGTWVTLQLALMGVGKIRLVDGDTVELSNLNRQVLYSKDDIGESKVSAAKQRLNQVNSNVEVEPFDEFVSRDETRIAELLRDVDMIVLAWASLGYFRKNTVEELVHHHAEQNQIPLIELGGDPIDITVGPIYAYDSDQSLNYGQQAATQADSYYSSDDTIKSFQMSRMKQDFLNGDRVVNAWQSAPSLATMSGLAVDQVVKTLTGYDEPFLVGRRFHMSMVNFETRVEQVLHATS